MRILVRQYWKINEKFAHILKGLEPPAEELHNFLENRGRGLNSQNPLRHSLMMHVYAKQCEKSIERITKDGDCHPFGSRTNERLNIFQHF